MRLVLALTVAVAAVSSGCEEATTCSGTGEPSFEWGQRLTSLTVDFGPVLLGSRVERRIKVVNNGCGPFAIEHAIDGDGFDPSFRYQFEPVTLDANGVTEIPVVFEPTSEGVHEGTFTLVISKGDIETLSLTVRGQAVNGRCQVTPADSLDFGSIAVGTTHMKRVKIGNPSNLDWKVTIGRISTQADEGAFAFSNFAPGDYVVPAQGELLVPVEFKPNHLGQHSAFLEIPAPAMCQPNMLRLTGNGFGQVLECEPIVTVTDPDTGAPKTACWVDFGFVSPGTKARRSVTFRNLGPTDLHVVLPDGALVQPAGKADPYSVESTQTQYVVAKEGGTATIDIAFLPTMLGQQNGKLKFTSDAPNRAHDVIELAGLGGGPDIDVLPSNVEFGAVGVGAYQYRRLTIANVGVDVGETTDDNLKLVNAAGEEVRALLITDSPDDWTLEWPPQGYLASGIRAGESVDFRVKFFPKSQGAKTATVRIWSNDPDEPAFDVVVSGTGQMMPPCDYEIVPPTLNYGTLENGKYRQMSFYIVNKASNPADECLVSTLGFARGTPDAFTLVKGPITGASIKGGESLQIPVRFAPKKDGSFTGAVDFYISSGSAPEGRVMLSGSSQAGCLMIAPSEFDFRVVGINCSSSEREFTVYNVCPTTIRIDSIETQTGLSHEFRFTQKPVLPKTLNSGEQVVFKATYRPIDIGEDTGSFAIQTAQMAPPYVVTVSGRTATVFVQTDVFTAADARPKVDVLLVVDDSASMSGKQASVGQNFASFIQSATAQNADYHLAVTTTSVDRAHGGSNDNGGVDPDENGRFVPVAGANPRVLTPSTPNVAAVFAQNVAVGAAGNADELLMRPAYLALTYPNLTGHNAGFLRTDADLAVIIVSDAQDSQSVPVDFYESFFKGLKSGSARVTVSGILPTMANAPGGCSYDDVSAGQSLRVRDLVTRMGGVVEEICTSDWAGALTRLGQVAFGGQRNRLVLSSRPDLSAAPLLLEIDGQPFAPTGPGGETRWTYDATANAIVFDPTTVIAPGAVIAVTYSLACLP